MNLVIFSTMIQTA